MFEIYSLKTSPSEFGSALTPQQQPICIHPSNISEAKSLKTNKSNCFKLILDTFVFPLLTALTLALSNAPFQEVKVLGWLHESFISPCFCKIARQLCHPTSTVCNKTRETGNYF